jgi:arylsulfatase A-like enzyme
MVTQKTTRRSFIRTIGAGGLAVTVPALRRGGSEPGRERPPTRPNVLLILCDDLGYGDLSCLGNTVNKTPQIDRFHAASARLTDFHVDPTCSPTRSALLTGRYSSRTGVWHTIMGRSILPRDEVTMAETFAGSGYRTGIFGKWHLGDNFPYRAQDRGFQESLVFGGGAIGNLPDYWGNDYFDDTYCRNGRWEKYSGYCQDVFFKAAIDFMAAAAGHPFFCYLPTNVPHWPHNVAEEYVRPYRGVVPDRRATLYGMIANLDENVGRILGFLRDSGLENDTIVVFTSDNGTGFGAEFDSDGFVTGGFNAGMRGDKSSAYEGGHRVPCFIRWLAGGIGGGHDVNELTAHFDLLPTLLGLCGLDRAEGGPLDGRSLEPLLRPDRGRWTERTLFVHNQRADEPIKWKDCAVMTTRWRLIDGRELYDIAGDREERWNVSPAHPDVVESLRREYERWWADVSGRFGDHVWIPVGAGGGEVVRLTGHDLHGQVCWDQSQVKRNARLDGFWTIEVASEGSYAISVRRFPEEADLRLRGAPTGFKAFNPTHARIKVADHDLTLRIHEDDKAVTFTVRLPRQRTRLQAWLIDDVENGETNGAYYVYVRPLG